MFTVGQGHIALIITNTQLIMTLNCNNENGIQNLIVFFKAQQFIEQCIRFMY